MGWLLSPIGERGPAAAICDYWNCGRVTTYSYMEKQEAVVSAGCYIASTSNKIYCPECKNALGKGCGTDEQKSKWTCEWWITEERVAELPVWGIPTFWVGKGKDGGNGKGKGKVGKDDGNVIGKGKDLGDRRNAKGQAGKGDNAAGSQDVPFTAKIHDDDDVVEEIQKMQTQLTTLSDVAADQSSELSSRFAAIDKNIDLIKESLELVLSNQVYLVTKMKRSRLIPKSIGDSDFFDNEENAFIAIEENSVVAPPGLST